MKPEVLLSALRMAARDAIGDQERVAVAYSGGLDSSVVAALAREVADTACYTCAMSDSLDAERSEGLARAQGLDWELVDLRLEDLRTQVRRVARIYGASDPVKIAYTIPLVVVLENSRERLVLTGAGADELFGGYARYRRLDDPAEQMRRDLDKMKGEARAIRAAFPDKALALPFEDDRVVELAWTLSPTTLMGASGGKLALREAAKLLGLENHSRPKKAAQYSSGVLKGMKRQAKDEGLQLAEWVHRVSEEPRQIP